MDPLSPACSTSRPASANVRSGRSTSRCCTGSTSMRRRSIASIRQPARNTRDADAAVDRLLRAARTRRIHRRAARRHLVRRRARRARAQGRGRALRSRASPLQRRPLRPARAILGRKHERGARREQRARSIASTPIMTPHADGRRHDDLQRARVQSRRAHDVPRRHAGAHGPRVRLRRARRARCPTARVFAHFDGETDRPDGAAVDSEGCYWSAFYRGGKVVRLSPHGKRLAEYPVPAMCPTMCAFGGADLRTLYVTSARQQRDADELARLPQSGGIFAMRVDVAGLARAEVRRLTLESPTGAPTGHRCSSTPPPSSASTRRTASARRASGASFATTTGDMLEVACFGPGVFRLRVGPNTRPDYGLVLGRAQRCDVAQPAPGVWTFSGRRRALEIAGEPLSHPALPRRRAACSRRSPTSTSAA